jgi:hypothetical protein
MPLSTLFADRAGRRRFLVGLSVLGVVGGSLVLLPLSVPILVLLSFVGMWNGMGRVVIGLGDGVPITVVS